MEDLALVVALMVFGTLLSGPLALGLAFTRFRAAKVAAVLLAIPGIVLGFNFALSGASTGSLVIGILGVSLSAAAIFTAFKRWSL